jgi:hypothetical protein
MTRLQQFRKWCVRLLMFHVLATLICSLCATCKSVGFWGDRVRDLADVATATVGKGWGLKGRVGPLQAGWVRHRDRAGIRNGCLLWWPSVDDGIGYFDNHARIYCTELCRLPDSAFARGKNYESSGLGFLVYIAFVDPGGVPSYMGRYYYSRLSLTLGLGASIHIEVNLGEVLDFVLGWFTIDIFNDDLGQKDRPPIGLHSGSHGTSSGWLALTLDGSFWDLDRQYVSQRPLSAILQPLGCPTEIRNPNMDMKSTILFSMPCFVNGVYEKDEQYRTKYKDFKLESGFRVYERQGMQLIPATFEVSPDDFKSFINAKLPDHSLKSLESFIAAEYKETSNK